MSLAVNVRKPTKTVGYVCARGDSKTLIWKTNDSLLKNG